MSAALAPITIPDFDRIFECGTCHGSGQVEELEDCDTCDGNGEVEDYDDEVEQCYDCDGSGRSEEYVDCDYCHGEGHDKSGFEQHAEPTLEALVEVFTSLRASGFEVDFGTACCQSCAFAAADPDESKGFIGFHEQDVEGLADRGRGIYLFHSLPTEAHENLVRVALASSNLTVQWDGTARTRIFVEAAA